MRYWEKFMDHMGKQQHIYVGALDRKIKGLCIVEDGNVKWQL